jgi:hypothetical protein
LNALKHGLRSSAVLLPGEDAAEFARLRHDQFSTYHPRTRDEANCVEIMTKCYWRMARCERWRAVYQAKHDTLLYGDLDGTVGQHCETDTHRWQHKALDCELEEGRLDYRMVRARRELLLLQQQRRQNLIPGAVDTTADWREFERAGEQAEAASLAAASNADAPASAAAPQPEPEAGATATRNGTPQGTSASSGNGIGKKFKRAGRPKNGRGGYRFRPAIGHG